MAKELRNISKEASKIDSKTKTLKIAKLSLQKKAQDIIILDLRSLTSIADYFIICSADNIVQSKAIADHIKEKLRDKPLKIEGLASSTWILMDYADVIVHIFEHSTRQYYELEKLWLDAPRILLDG